MISPIYLGMHLRVWSGGDIIQNHQCNVKQKQFNDHWLVWLVWLVLMWGGGVEAMDLRHHVFILFRNGAYKFAHALQSMDRRQIRHDGRFQSPPALLALERDHLFFAQLAHELRFCHAPHLPLMKL